MTMSLKVSKKDIQYMELCAQTARIFSTCAKKKYAAVLVDQHGHIVGMGYNGGPKGHIHCEDGGCPRLADNSPSGSSYDNCIAIHAEANALLHCNYTSMPEKIYVNGPPCFSCAKLLVNSTVKAVYCLSSVDYKQWESVKNFLIHNNIKVIEVNSASS